jgi:hypothetical protein
MESSSKLGGALFFIFFLNTFDNKLALQLQLQLQLAGSLFCLVFIFMSFYMELLLL